METNFVYRLIFPTGQFYIGSTCELDKRIDRHIRELQAGNHHNTNVQKLHNAGFVFDLELDNFRTRDEAYAHEGKLIRENAINPNMLNIGLDARGGDNLTNNPDRLEIITKRTESCIATMKTLTPMERKEKYGLSGEANGMYGRTHTSEVKESSSKRNMGNSYAKGSIRSAEMRVVISEHAKQRKGNKNPFFGKTHSDTTKEKLREANKGRLPPNTRKVVIDGITYESATTAAKVIGCSIMTILNRINNTHEKFSGYSFLDSMAVA